MAVSSPAFLCPPWAIGGGPGSTAVEGQDHLLDAGPGDQLPVLPSGVSPTRLLIRAQIAIMKDRPATRRAALEEQAFLHEQAFEDALVRLAERYGA